MAQLQDSAKHSTMIGIDLDSELSSLNSGEIPNGKLYRKSRPMEMDSFPLSERQAQSPITLLKSLLVVSVLVSTLVFLFVCLVVPLFNAVNHPNKELKTMDSIAPTGGHGHPPSSGACPPGENGNMEGMGSNHDHDGAGPSVSEEHAEMDTHEHSHNDDSLERTEVNSVENSVKETRTTDKNSSRDINKSRAGNSRAQDNPMRSMPVEEGPSDEDLQSPDDSSHGSSGSRKLTVTEVSTHHAYQRFLKYTMITCNCSGNTLDVGDTLAPLPETLLTCLYRCMRACGEHFNEPSQQQLQPRPTSRPTLAPPRHRPTESTRRESRPSA